MNGFHSDEHGFYLVRDMVALCVNKPVLQVPLTTLQHNMGMACWSGGLTPWQVVMDITVGGTEEMGMDDESERQKHKQRISDADLSFPLIVSADGWYNIFDGMHRLCKARQMNHRALSCVLLSRQEMRAIRRNKDELVALLSGTVTL